MKCTHTLVYINTHPPCTSCTTRHRSISLFGTLIRSSVQDSSQEQPIDWESPFLLLPLPGPNHPTPRKATPTFPALRQAHKGLPKNGQGRQLLEVPAPRHFPVLSAVVISPVSKHLLLARCGGAGATPGGCSGKRNGSEYLEDAGALVTSRHLFVPAPGVGV